LVARIPKRANRPLPFREGRSGAGEEGGARGGAGARARGGTAGKTNALAARGFQTTPLARVKRAALGVGQGRFREAARGREETEAGGDGLNPDSDKVTGALPPPPARSNAFAWQGSP